MSRFNKGLEKVKKAASKRQVRIPSAYMSWAFFIDSASLVVAEFYDGLKETFSTKEEFSNWMNGGSHVTVPDKQDFIGMIHDAALFRQGFRCYCVEPELVDRIVLDEFDLERMPVEYAIVFFPRYSPHKDLSSLIYAIVTGEENGKVSVCLGSESIGGRIDISLQMTTIEDLKLSEGCPYLDAVKVCLMALNSINQVPEFQEQIPKPHTQGFGKKQSNPVTFEYPIMLKQNRVIPLDPVRVDRGGTHASPRPHDRRGHWRRKPKGDVNDLIWVRQSKVGSK